MYKLIKEGLIIGYSNTKMDIPGTICEEIPDISYQNKETYTKELIELKEWFYGYYTEHEQKYRRLIALNILDDDGQSPENKLNNLYNDAELKRKRIQELENLINI